MSAPKKLKIPSAKSEDQPATRKMLYLVRDELKSEIRASERKMDARFRDMEARFNGLESRFAVLESNLESKIEEICADTQRTNLLVEEQNANNRIVLEGLQALWQRQDRIEAKLS